jgi:tRNA(Ile)-lysidine synthase
MIKRMENSVKKYQLFRHGDHVLVAVSGGADSVALLLGLYEKASSLGISLAVAHLNHCIRGKASDTDAKFVKKLATRLGIPYIGARVNVPRLAEKNGLSMEMAAREARYSFLVQTARDVRAGIIATAHTADDQAETVLLKLARGAGPRGMAGIPRSIFFSGVRIVRPLLDVKRSEIEEFLKEQKQSWREDRTNRDPAYLRNLVRHKVLPFLEKTLNPDIRTALIRTADILRREEEWLDELSDRILKRCVNSGEGNVLLLGGFKEECVAARRRVLRQWLSLSGVPPELIDYDVVTRIEDLIDTEKGTGEAEITGRHVVKKRYDRLVVEQGGSGLSENFCYEVKIPGETIIDSHGLRIVTVVKSGIVKDKLIKVGQIPASASINFPAIGTQKLVVRSWLNGDRMKPFGMAGSKKLQDIFIDGKVSPEERNRIPVFECGGEIVWIPGYHVARGWEVKDPAEACLHLSIES